MGEGKQGHNPRNDTLAILGIAVSFLGKKWMRVSRFAWYHPLLFMRIWNVQGKWADFRMPRSGSTTLS